MSANIPESVLSDALQEAIKDRRVKTAVFLTFQFDPAFFEADILPVLFTQSFSHVAKLRLLQLEEVLHTVNHIAVYYDRQGLTSDAEPAQLDYRRIGLARSIGIFHPKNILLLLENTDKDQTWESLLFGTLSANLTRSGWWENVETAHFMEVHEGEACSYRDELLRLISRIKQEDRIEEEHLALEAIRTFLLRQIITPRNNRKNGRLLPQVYVGQNTVPEYLVDFTSRDSFNLEIISPYFDATATALLILLDTVQPKAVRIFLPKDTSGAAQCTPEFNEAIQQRARVEWGLLPDAMLSMGTGSETNAANRFVHAKVYRFWNQQREILFIGSVNLTSPAHSAGNAGNFETGVLVEPDSSGQRTWWLKSLEEDVPVQFHPENVEDVEPDAAVGDVSFQFDWKSGVFQYFWERRPQITPDRATLRMQGVCVEENIRIRFDKWVPLSNECAEKVKQQLASTSFVEVSADGQEQFRVLVREEQMAYKPSILLTLTPEDILQYWSLLSPEQRELLLITKILTAPGGADVISQMGIPVPYTTQTTMFDRFAGIFHAFARLEVHLNDALNRGLESEAVYRLFGHKFDSLPSLINKVIQDENDDRVNRYVSLLCAGQTVEHVRKGYSEFTQRHRSDFAELKRQLEAIAQIRSGFTFDTPEQRQMFFDWFEEMFSAKLDSAKAEVTE